MKGKFHKKESKLLTSEKLKGRPSPFKGKFHSTEAKNKVSRPGIYNPAWKGWWITPLGKFSTIELAAKSNNIGKSALQKYCKLKYKPGFDYEYNL